MSDGNLWDPTAEGMSRSELVAQQGELLAEQVAFAYANSPLLRSKYRAAGLTPTDVRGSEDLWKLPLIEKDDIRTWRARTGDAFGGLLCVPRSELAFVNHSTGTSGAPTIFGATEADLEHTADAFARALYAIGMRTGDTTPMSGTTFWHGVVIGYSEGARRLGATPVRIGVPNQACVQTILSDWADFDFDSLRTYLPELELPLLRAAGIKPAKLFPNARFVYAGFDVSAPKRRLIEEAFGMPYRNTVASGDQFFGGGECDFSAPASHMPEDHFLFEVLDPETLQPSAPGEPGELVVTNLRARGCPIIRYRMEDIVVADPTPCRCGRSHVRLRVLGRLAWSVDVQGQSVFSADVEEAVWSVDGLAGTPYQLVRVAPQPQERLLVRLAGAPADATPGRNGRRDETIDAATAALERRFGVPAAIEVVEEDQIGMGGPIKMQRILDVSRPT